MERICRLWLIAIAHITKNDMSALLQKYGSAEAIFNLSDEEIRSISFLTDEEKDCLCLRETDLAENYLEYIANNNTRFLIPDDEDYPHQLFNISNPPHGLFCRGSFVDMNSNILIGVVGARKCSQYGYECAKVISRDAAREGAVIVSGMAVGIDSAAHEGALAAKRPTIAVLGCGVNVIYPSSNHNLMKRIMETGMVISEYPVNTKASRYTFPERNRILSGISDAVMVVEASLRSGSLITARYAQQQDKPIFAVPGNINSNLSKGTNGLLKNGAFVTESAEDITSHFSERLKVIKDSMPPEKISQNEYSFMSGDNNDNEKLIYSLLSSEPQTVDELSIKSDLPPQIVTTTLLIMELNGRVSSYPGGKYSLSIQ